MLSYPSFNMSDFLSICPFSRSSPSEMPRKPFFEQFLELCFVLYFFVECREGQIMRWTSFTESRITNFREHFHAHLFSLSSTVRMSFMPLGSKPNVLTAER